MIGFQKNSEISCHMWQSGARIDAMKSALVCVLFLARLFAYGQQPLATPASSYPPPAPLDSATRGGVAENFAQLLADNYAYPEVGVKMADAIREKLKSGAYNKITSPTEFADALQTDARAVSNDLHLRVGFGVRAMPQMQAPSSTEMYTQSLRQNGGISSVQILEGNIGYLALDIQVFQNPVAKDAIASAFAFVHNTDALILDIRGNPGGNGGPELILSYLSEGSPYVASIVHWRKDNLVQQFHTINVGDRSYGSLKPVYVLTSHTTFSAAENLAYEIQSFKRGTIVGETTGGGANPSGGAGLPPLGHGFTAQIPNGYVVNPVTGKNWEGVGVKPNIVVSASQAFGIAWSLAAQRLSESAPPDTFDPQHLAILQALAVAKLDGNSSLSTTQLAGTYLGPNGTPQVTIIEKNGQLLIDQHQPFSAQIPLIPEGGDRYRPATFSAGFSLTFVVKDGQIGVLRSDLRGSMLLGKE